MAKMQLIATSAFGIEAVTARELKLLGYEDQFVENGKVTFYGDENAICRTNIWLRTADRILLKMGEFKALTFDELFEGTKALPWDEWLPEDALFPVDGKSIDSKLASVPDCQAIVKKAIVEKMKKRYKREIFEETGPKYRVEVSLLKDMATITIDTSGAGLHKRGYRKLAGEAPLKETLACAMLLISRWRENRVLIDPFCGTGTIPIEAAMMGMNMAPGIKREFASETWANVGLKYWQTAREEANDLIRLDQELRISGSDIDEKAMSMARYHAVNAGVDKHIHLQKMDMANVSSKYKYGFFICNPPYGERLGEKKSVELLYGKMGEVFKKFDTWSYYVITSNQDFEKNFRRKADKKRKLYNGRLMCNYYQFFGPPPPKNNSSDSSSLNQ